jgi:hypothetical protein
MVKISKQVLPMFDKVEFKDLKLFVEDDGYIINQLGKALNPEDILDAWDITKKELMELESDDYKFFMHHYKQGRVAGKMKAVNTIIDSLEGKNAAEVAVKYLKQFTRSWETVENTAQKGPGILKLVLDKFEDTDYREEDEV